MSALKLIRRLVLALLFAALLCARPLTVASDPGVTPWSSPFPIAEHEYKLSSPTLAFTPDGMAHAVWEDDSGSLLYASRLSSGAWGAPVYVAMGSEPSLAVSGADEVHLLFRNNLFGNNDIYYTRIEDGQWALPVNVSHTSGVSSQPVLLATREGKFRAAWADDTPGYRVIYYGEWEPGAYWSSQPVPNALGQAPALTAADDGTVYLAWQDKPGLEVTYDVFVSQRLNQAWTLPVDVSDSRGIDSRGVTLVSASDGLAHLVWVENDQSLVYVYGRTYDWSARQVVTTRASVIEQPQLGTEHANILYLAWHQDQAILATYGLAHNGEWRAPGAVTVTNGDSSLKDVNLAAMPLGGASVTWVESHAAGETVIYESIHGPVLNTQMWYPLMVH